MLAEAGRRVERTPGADPATVGRVDEGGAYRELAGIVLANQPLDGTLTRVAELTRDVVSGADDVSVTVIRDGKPRSVAFAGDSELALVLDERQYRDGFGPCLDAAASARTIVVPDTAGEEVYPEFARVAAENGVRHTVAVGLPTLHAVGGAINVYSRGAAPFSAEALSEVSGFAGYAAVALTNATLYDGALQHVAQMQEAMASRAVIEQAKGVLMQVQGIGDEEAFELLRRASSHRNKKLRDVAQSIVEGARRR
jgi:GAF domain-containing protein